jgi:hypothetical protein
MRFLVFAFLFLLVSCGSPPVKTTPTFSEKFDAVFSENKTTISAACSVDILVSNEYSGKYKTLYFHNDGKITEGLKGSFGIGHNDKSLYSNIILEKLDKVIFLYEITDKNGKIIIKSFKEVIVHSEPTK